MHLSHVLLLAGALGAAAHPSAHGHNHLHRSVHDKRKFYKAERPHIPIPIPTSSAAAVASSTAAEPASKPTQSTQEEYIPFCGGNKKVKRVTKAQVAYKGNTGQEDGCEWNSNMLLISEGIASMYDYVQTYTNVDDNDNYECRCFNKIGADGGLTGMFSVSMPKQLKFTLAPGETKYLAFESNTQGVCACAPKEVPLTEFGQLAGTWMEFDFENTSNGGWSGADCSSLVAQHYDMDVPGCSMCEGGVCSKIFPGGKGDNAYTKGMEELDGIGLNIKPGPCTIDVKVGNIS